MKDKKKLFENKVKKHSDALLEREEKLEQNEILLIEEKQNIQSENHKLELLKKENEFKQKEIKRRENELNVLQNKFEIEKNRIYETRESELLVTLV